MELAPAGWVYLGFLVLAWAAIGHNGFARWRSEARLSVGEPAAVPSPAPLVSIVVPCRDEERNVGPCIESLLTQQYPNLELIVVDDQSRDATLSLVTEFASRDPRVTIVAGKPLPAGWTGKNHAIYQGTKHARGQWLLFTDADTRHRPNALAHAVDEALSQRCDLFSLVPRREAITFWEKVLHPVVMEFQAWHFSTMEINDPEHTAAAANGQYILVRREAYEAVGGHEAIKDTVREDVELGRSFKGAGYRIRLAMAMDLVVTRMYASLHEMWEGWTKSFFLDCGSSLALTLRIIMFFVFVGIAPAVLWIVLLMTVLSGEASDAALALFVAVSALLAGVWTAKALFYRRLQLDPRYALLDFLGYGVVVGILMNSAYKGRFAGETVWKGRRYHD